MKWSMLKAGRRAATWQEKAEEMMQRRRRSGGVTRGCWHHGGISMA